MSRGITWAIVAVGILAGSVAAQEPMQFEAFAVNLSGGPRTSTATIQRWPQAAAERLIAAVTEKGTDALWRWTLPLTVALASSSDQRHPHPPRTP